MRRAALAVVGALCATAALAQQSAPPGRGGTEPYLPIPSFRDMMQPGGGSPEPADRAGAADVRLDDDGPTDPNADVAFGAFQRGFYRKALDEAQKRATAKPPSPQAMTLVGELYANGYGVPRRPEEAVRWYARAAEAGDPKAMSALALAKLDGFGAPKDEKGAAALLEKAAEKNDAQALYNLGLIRLERSRSAQDDAAAARLLKRGAELGEAAAQYAYASLLREGRGVEKDASASIEWMRRAAEQDDVAALVEYAIAVFKGAGTIKNEEEAARLFRRAADRGNAIAQNRLARLYAYGRGVPRDAARAAAWHSLATAQGLKDPWLEGFVETLKPEDRKAAQELTARWSENFGPVARTAEATATAVGGASPRSSAPRTP